MNKQGFIVNWPGKIVFGEGKLDAVGEEARALGARHALLVTTKDLLHLGVVERAERVLRSSGLTVRCFDDVQPDPSCEAVDEAALLGPLMYPRVALVDPELTYTMPPAPTANP
jgi:alcohol dehydrogenase class IV